MFLNRKELSVLSIKHDYWIFVSETQKFLETHCLRLRGYMGFEG